MRSLQADAGIDTQTSCQFAKGRADRLRFKRNGARVSNASAARSTWSDQLLSNRSAWRVPTGLCTGTAHFQALAASTLLKSWLTRREFAPARLWQAVCLIERQRLPGGIRDQSICKQRLDF